MRPCGRTSRSDYATFSIVARNAEGEILGGLIGGTSYGWLLVKMLWVADEARGQGLGTRIMALAEDVVRGRGCHGAWLDTSSRRARRFYEKLGYEAFGILENRDGERPEGHARFFLSKRFAPPEEGPDSTWCRHSPACISAPLPLYAPTSHTRNPLMSP